MRWTYSYHPENRLPHRMCVDRENRPFTRLNIRPGEPTVGVDIRCWITATDNSLRLTTPELSGVFTVYSETFFSAIEHINFVSVEFATMFKLRWSE